METRKFDTNELMSQLKENFIGCIGDYDLKSKYDNMENFMLNVSTIENYLREAEKVEKERDQYKKWWLEEREKFKTYKAEVEKTKLTFDIE